MFGVTSGQVREQVFYPRTSEPGRRAVHRPAGISARWPGAAGRPVVALTQNRRLRPKRSGKVCVALQGVAAGTVA